MPHGFCRTSLVAHKIYHLLRLFRRHVALRAVGISLGTLVVRRLALRGGFALLAGYITIRLGLFILAFRWLVPRLFVEKLALTCRS